MAATRFRVDSFPPTNIDWQRLIPLIGPANAAVARYDGVLQGIPNADVLLSPLTTQEATLSSKIEGTQATFSEVLQFEASEDTATGEKRDDIREILNYRAALRNAIDQLKKIPLSQRVIKNTHFVLMQGVRGKNKAPGEYRRGPNWIGPLGCTIEEAKFIPPSAEQIPDAISKWEKYLHHEEPDKLVQLAILHAQFEAIHPFLDGNGRIGRLLVPLFLVDKKILSTPNFYMSAYLEAHREEYYERLLEVSRDGDWTGWCRFFLQGVTEQAKFNQEKATAILALYNTMKNQMTNLTRSQYAVRALDWFFNQPIFNTSDFISSSDIPKPTASRIIKLTRDRGLLREIRPASGRRPALLILSDLLNITEGTQAF